MSFFKRKEKNLIPPIAEPAPRNVLTKSRDGSNSSSPAPAYRSNAATYVPSRDGDLYGSKSSTPSPAPPSGAYSNGYTRNTVGDVYTRGQANIDNDRGELFSGYKPPEKGSGRFFDDGPGQGGAGGGEGAPGEEDEDVEGIKQQLRFTKQESVNSTRNALRLAREAEETARNTLGKLGDQSGMYCHRHLSQYRRD